ncbi:MAG: class I SAM-dependent methyltransferase [Terracidiphilus sp.]
MNWKIKAFVQGAISAMPRSAEVNYAFQRYISRNLPPKAATMRHALDTILSDFAVMREHLSVPVNKAQCFEFGAGATFLGPLAFYCLGIEDQTLVDIHRLLRPELANCAIRFLREQQDTDFIRKPHELVPEGVHGQGMIEWFKNAYGISYRAPCDARRTPFAPGSFDVITSKAVLEHVPKQDIGAILTECKRILRDDGVVAFRIDYQDHYSYYDPKVSIYNFLQYTDAEWRKYSPSLHFMNRLRHRDYLELFKAAGFEVLAEVTYEIREEDLAVLSKLPLAPRFAGYSERELAIRGAHTTCAKAKANRVNASLQVLTIQ